MKKIIYEDDKRRIELSGYTIKVYQTGSKKPKIGSLHKAFCDKNLPSKVKELLIKKKETPETWYTLWEGVPGQCSPALVLPDSTRDAVENAIKEVELLKNIEKEKEEQETKTRKEKAIAECPIGHVIAKQNWANGDLRSAEYQLENGTKIIASDLLTNHYGYYYINASDAENESAKTKAKTEKLEKEKQIKIKQEEDIKETAKKTGQKQILKTYMTQECARKNHDCSFDAVTEYIMPDGTKKVIYTCCY